MGGIKIGVKIKALRKRDDITQERLAEVLGVTSQAISKWESESGYPDIEYITPIANFFNVTIDYLFEHDMAEKNKKIDEYCEQFDVYSRENKPPQERVDMMRKALAEFPAEPKLMFRLAKALYNKWCSYGWHSNMVDGYPLTDYETHKSFDSWEEAVKIMEELLTTSIDDAVRSECRELLAYIYGRIGEKEKVLAIAEKCDDIFRSKENILAQAFALSGKDSVTYEQKRLIALLHTFGHSFTTVAKFTNNQKTINESYNTVINLYKFIFNDGYYGFYNAELSFLYQSYSWELIGQDNIDETFKALENAYIHTKMFDIYKKEVIQKGFMQYTSPFVNNVSSTEN